jgi:hypothetical protein
MATYACSDLHGRLDLYNKIKEKLAPTDNVYFLGDAGDRGPDGLELIKTILHDEQFIYLKGNHEDMFINAALEYLATGTTESTDYQMLIGNGGKKTFCDWVEDGKSIELIDQLKALPVHAVYNNKSGQTLLLSHAGYTPWHDSRAPTCITTPYWYELIWSREHFQEPWDDEHFKNCIIVHGHTPTIHLANYLNDPSEEIRAGAYWYCNNHKVCVDNLSSFTDIACLLNLDTLKDEIITI